MDIRGWKKIMLQWITECGFMERNYFNIEQSDIDIFYQNFCEHHRRAGEELVTTETVGFKNKLIAFLKEHYPAFEPHLDDENALSSADYIYVYSLLLHFSCVKYPEAHFHVICQKLTEQSQQCIASFFKQLLDCESISKENLRHAIAHVANTHLSPRQTDSSNSSNDQSNSLTSPNVRLESCVKTPLRQVSNTQRISPSTPKSFLLEERTRELYNLRAQLETERYEKGLLEVQIKQNEDKILQLNHDHKKLQQQIQDLKNDILTKDTENGSPSRVDDQQIKRRLCKDIAQKEQEIFKLADVLNTLQEEKSLVKEKLILAERQIDACMERIKELDYKVDDLSVELERKNDTIKYLTDNKLELEHFISETRSASSSSRPDFNVSSDCLDTSFSRATNSSASFSSPENLGCSVIDKRLREKEYENDQLREQLAVLHKSNACLAKHIHTLFVKYTEEYQFNNSSIVNEAEVNCADPAEHFLLFVNCVNAISKSFKEEQCRTKKLQDETQNLEMKNGELHERINKLETNLQTLQEQFTNSESTKAELQHSRDDFKEKLAKSEQEIEALNKQRLVLVTNLENMANDYDVHKVSSKAKLNDFTEQVEKLQQELLAHNQKSEQMIVLNQTLEQEIDNLQSELQNAQAEIKKILTEQETTIKSLNEKILHKEKEREAHCLAERKVKEKYEKLYIEHEAMRSDKRATDEHLQTIHNELAVKEIEMGEIGIKIIDGHAKNKELEERINILIKEHNKTKLNSEHAINKRDDRIKEIDGENSKLQAQLNTTQQELKNLKLEFEQNQEQQHQMQKRLTAMNSYLQMPYENNLLASLGNTVSKVKELFDYRIEATNRIESLEFENIENSAQIQQLQQTLERLANEREDLLLNQERDFIKVKSQLEYTEQQISEYEEKIAKLGQEQTELTQRLENELQRRDEEFSACMQQSSSKYESALEKLRTELAAEKDYYAVKERELKAVIAEYNVVKQKLNEMEKQTIALQADHIQNRCNYEYKINELEEQVTKINAENSHSIEAIETFKQEHTLTKRRLEEADQILKELSAKLVAENASKTELDLKLKVSEMRLEQAEDEIADILKEKSYTFVQLHASYESQSEKLKYAEDKLAELENAKSEHLQTIAKMQQEIQAITNEKESMQQNANVMTVKMENEQAERAKILQTLEETADQLRIAAELKEDEVKNLQQCCNTLQKSSDDAKTEAIKLQAELMANQAKLSLILEDQQQERNNLELQHGDLMRKLAEQSLKLEAHDVTIIEIMAILENNFNISIENNNADVVKNVFKAQATNVNGSNLNKLKMMLNELLYKITQLSAAIKSSEDKETENTTLITKLNKEKDELVLQTKRDKRELTELQELLASETKTLQNKLRNEVKRLNEDIQNLENVNEKLTNENVNLQIRLSGLEDELKENKSTLVNLKEQHAIEISQKHSLNQETIKKLDQHANEQSEKLRKHQVELEKLQEQHSKLQQQLKERSTTLSQTETELQVAKDKSQKLQTRLQQLERKHANTERKLKEVEDKFQLQRVCNETMDNQLTQRNTELSSLQSKITDIINIRNRLEEQLKTSTKRLDDSIAAQLASDSKSEQLNSQLQQLKRDLEFSKSQHQTAVCDVERLARDLETMKGEKLQLHADVKDGKRELQRTNDNITELIQQIVSIRSEKEAIVEENNLLRKQHEENGKFQSSSQTKLNSTLERSQMLERNLLSAENELKSVNSNLEKSEKNAERYCAENRKLRESQDSLTKRVEKLALRLGDSQANCAKFERENDKLLKTVEAHATTVEAVQREKDLLQNECKSLRERVSKAERGQEQLTVKVQTLELAHDTLAEAKQKLEAFEIEAKTKLSKLEKVRESNEEKLRKLNSELSNSENANVRLNLEIGALNSQLSELKKSATQQALIESIKKQLQDSEEKAQKYERLNQKLEVEMRSLQEENCNIKDQLAKAALSLKISKDKCENVAREMEQLRDSIMAIKDEKLKAEREYHSTRAKLQQFETLNEQLIADKQKLVEELEIKVLQFETDLAAKVNEVASLQTVVAQLQTKSLSSDFADGSKSELEAVSTRLALAEATLEKEQHLSAQLRTDNQILQAKYRESKQRAIEESNSSEERIKENRLELEGKLEKMKNKMKTLYTDEIAKIKTKQDRETAYLKTELAVLKAQNEKYEEHTRKLSSQIVRLNDRILEYQKDNAIITTKLKHLEEHNELLRFKRPSTITVASSSAAAAAAAAPAFGSAAAANIGTNLAMEDEEGEVFNNTYLTDLKNGHMPELMSRDICAEELQFRNSLLPPHLKSTYAAQYDHGLAEDELKDGPHSLDDSMSALLSTTAGGTRKKITGVTHYKRPGPPTPSKNGGRLSFGGSSEPAREILKESYECGNAASGTVSSTSSTKTPARFGFFGSRFSMGNPKDELNENALLDLRKVVHKKNMLLQQEATTARKGICTSTPRKSKSHYDQRRLLDELLKNCTPSSSPLKSAAVAEPNDESLKETPLTTQQLQTSAAYLRLLKPQQMTSRKSRGFILKRRMSKRLQRADQLRLNTASSGDTNSSAQASTPAVVAAEAVCYRPSTVSSGDAIVALQRRLRRRSMRQRSGRPSLHLCSNIFAKYRTPTKVPLRDLHRRKARMQRNDNIHKLRMHLLPTDDKAEVDNQECDDDDAESYDENRNSIHHKNNNSKTMLVNKNEPKDHEHNDDGVQVSEQFEQFDIDNHFASDLTEHQKLSIAILDIKEERMSVNHTEENFTNDAEEYIIDNAATSASVQHFEQLLLQTESHAPFQVQHIRFSTIPAIRDGSDSHRKNSLESSSKKSANTANSDQLHLSSSSSSLTLAPCSTVISTANISAATTATPVTMLSNNSSTQLSRIIYGGSVIYNRRLPNINTTYARKSSIYIKNHKNDATMQQDDIILVTNQTITLMDLFRMWHQMNRTTRVAVVFAILACFITFYGVFKTCFFKR